jgi:predicted TIM-barrel fold metal-dependent hydrolase
MYCRLILKEEKDMKRLCGLLTGLLIFICLFGIDLAAGEIADSHFHNANYAMQGVPLKEIIDKYMGDKIARSVVFPLPLQQKWDRFEHYTEDKMPPNYYMGPKAGMYYYSAIDAVTAIDYLKLSSADKARLDPMIVGFNPMDQYGVTHIKRMLILYPGVFEGIGEFSVHKELVGDKIDDDLTRTNLAPGEKLPPDATDSTRNTLYNPSLKTIFDFAAEAGLLVCLHSDVYPARVSHDGKVVTLSPEAPYTAGMKHLCAGSPKTTVYWAHTGLGRFVKPAPDHLQVVSEILDACPNWYTDLSWDLVQSYIVTPKPGMPTLDDWAGFVKKYQDRILWGSDSVIYTRNKADDKGNISMGMPMSVADYLGVKDILNPLWGKIGPEVTYKVRYANHVRLFDAARAKVRAWEASHTKDNVWDLSAQ